MLPFLSVLPSTIAAIGAEGLFVHGLLAVVIGLIAWSKYTEPPFSHPYPAERLGPEYPDAATRAVPVPVVAKPRGRSSGRAAGSTLTGRIG